MGHGLIIGADGIVIDGNACEEIDPDDRFDLPVTMISFESLIADADVAVRIESLHDTSTDVDTPAPDLVYQNFKALWYLP